MGRRLTSRDVYVSRKKIERIEEEGDVEEEGPARDSAAVEGKSAMRGEKFCSTRKKRQKLARGG